MAMGVINTSISAHHTSGCDLIDNIILEIMIRTVDSIDPMLKEQHTMFRDGVFTDPRCDLV